MIGMIAEGSRKTERLIPYVILSSRVCVSYVLCCVLGLVVSTKNQTFRQQAQHPFAGKVLPQAEESDDVNRVCAAAEALDGGDVRLLLPCSKRLVPSWRQAACQPPIPPTLPVCASNEGVNAADSISWSMLRVHGIGINERRQRIYSNERGTQTGAILTRSTEVSYSAGTNYNVPCFLPASLVYWVWC